MALLLVLAWFWLFIIMLTTMLARKEDRG